MTLTEANPATTFAFMQEWFGFGLAEEMDGRMRVSVNGTGPGKSVDILTAKPGQHARNGVGTVHHVAMAIGTDEEQLELRNALVKNGIHVTPVIDRSYFHSIYFREPGGVLFEVATVTPRIQHRRAALPARPGPQASPVGRSESRGHRVGAASREILICPWI